MSIQQRNGRMQRKISGFELFRKWIDKNSGQFKHKPYCYGNQLNVFCFEGITTDIQCRFSNSGDMMICVYHDGEHLDIIMEFDLYEDTTADGKFFCTLCRDNPGDDRPLKYYDTREELWAEHSFQSLLAYANGVFVEGAKLVLFKYGSTTSTMIFDGEMLENARLREYFHKEIDVFEGAINEH